MILTIISTSIFTSFFIILTIFFHLFKKRKRLILEEESKEKTVDELLDKYVNKEKKDIMKEKLLKISEIIAETEKHIESTVKKKVDRIEKDRKIHEKEFEVIKKANVEYVTFTSGFRSALPKTEEEKMQDISDLKDAMAMLESLDSMSIDISKKNIGVGVGMFYDKISRNFKNIINENHLNDNRFIPSERLKYHAFLNIKNIKNSDILPVLSIMRETKLLNDVIEINPTFYMIVFSDIELELTNPEKVLLTFAYDEDSLTIQKLIELTEWKSSHAEKVIESLKKKGIISIKEDEIFIEGFGHPEERRKWNETITIHLNKEKEKEEARFQRNLERRKKLEELIEQKEKKERSKAEAEAKERKVSEKEQENIKFNKKPKIKNLPKINAQEIKDKDALLGAMDALDEEMKDDRIKAAEIDDNSKDLSFEDTIEIDGETRDLSDLIPEKVLDYHEKFSLINGGLVQFEKLKNYVKQELIEVTDDISEELFKQIINQLKELQMIQDIIKTADFEFLLFNEIKLNFLHRRFISHAIDKAPLMKEDYMKDLNWEEEKVLKTMKELQEIGVLRIENEKIVIPGIIQNE